MANPGVQPQQGQPQQQAPQQPMSPEQLMTILSQLAQSGGQLQPGQQPAQNGNQVSQDHLGLLLPLLIQALTPQSSPPQAGQGGQPPQQGQAQQGQQQQAQQQPQQGQGQQQNPLMQILQSLGIHLG